MVRLTARAVVARRSVAARARARARLAARATKGMAPLLVLLGYVVKMRLRVMAMEEVEARTKPRTSARVAAMACAKTLL